jgi:release factor glutamine methyltransferase
MILENIQTEAQKTASTYGELLYWGEDYLASRGIESPQISSERLLEKVSGRSRISLLLEKDLPVTSGEKMAFMGLLKERGDSYPLQYLLGETAFRHLDLKIEEGVLIPRPETELLVDEVHEHFSAAQEFSVLDLGTGSGNIILSIAQEFESVQAYAVDISQTALELARENAGRNHLTGKVQFLESDLFQAVEPHLKFDCIVSNPPYIADPEKGTLQKEVGFEPEQALFSGPTGLETIRKILDGAGRFLRAGGLLILEAGEGQAEMIREYAKTAGFDTLRTRKDYLGIERIMTFKWKN